MTDRIPPPVYESNEAPSFHSDEKESLYSAFDGPFSTNSIPYGTNGDSSSTTGTRPAEPSPAQMVASSIDSSIAFHIYKDGPFSSEQRVMADDKSTILFRISAPRSLLKYELKIYSVDEKGEKVQDAISSVSKGSYGFSSNDVRIEMRSGWCSVLYSTGVNFESRDFVGLGVLGDKFRWGKRPKTDTELECVNLRTGEIVAQWRRTNLAAKKSGELVVNTVYEKDFNLILITLFGFEEWTREQALLFKADGGAAI